uniref:Protein O-mannosyl-transferase 2 n=1 Tax=Daphnia magna TaxID=35525 RepID=A0A0P4XP58_9CRUS
MKEKASPACTVDSSSSPPIKTSLDKQSTSQQFCRPAFTQKFRESTSGKVWWTIFTLLMVATVSVRFYKLRYPEQVCWDETHFGRHANQYLQRTFFFDVHPPLGKMLVALFGYLDGYDGSFWFEVGKKYGDASYMGMRIGCAIMGALVVPLCFLTIWEMTASLPASTFTALCLIFDNSLVVLNRFILLDPMMLFFISATFFSMAHFNKQKRSFSFLWWFWLSSTGMFMAGSFSVKFVGLFLVFLVGMRAIYDLWIILGDMSHPVTYTVKHFLARALCLIALPVALYVVIFYVHLRILHLGGEEDEFYSSAFQVSLKGNMFHNSTGPREVAYGAVIRVKNNVLEGQYLHSHRQLYPVGARQQQITTVYIRDPNNRWFIKRHNQSSPLWNATDPIDLVRNGDLIRIEHRTTGRNLHVHRGPAPISNKMYQVTGYGVRGEGNDDDFWRLEIEGAAEGEVLEIVRHSFRLVSPNNKCVLTSTTKNLPEWGFGSAEVACNPKIHDDRAYWHIDDNRYPRLPNVSYTIYELSFLERFIESHKNMFMGNAGFRPKISDFQSRPWMWPINFRGQFFSVEGVVIYLLGNPIIWWGHCLCFLFYFLLWIVNAVIEKRAVNISDKQLNLQRRTLNTCKWLFIGFLCHYIPFWPMARILYFHHYFPALLFSNMISGMMLNYILETFSEKISPKFYTYFVSGLLLAFFYSFYLFTPITYGYPNRPSQYNDSQMYGMKWISSWEF